MVSGPIIRTKRLTLRPIEMADAPAHFKCMSDWEIIRFFAKTFPWPYPADGSPSFIERMRSPEEKTIYWAITMHTRPGAEANELIGAIELRPHRDEGQRGFWVSRNFHNQGIMTEAVCAVNDYWFDTLNRPTLHMANAVSNEASRRIKEKTGAKFLGTRADEHVDPALNMLEMWLITREEWHNFRNKQGL